MPSSSKKNQGRTTKDVVVNHLKELFGSVFHLDIIRSVATQFNFDIEQTTNALLEMTNNIEDPQQQPWQRKAIKTRKPPTKPAVLQPSPSANTLPKSRKVEAIERAIHNVRQGYKVLVILRGLPGSGKSHLAVNITDATLGPGNNSHHILSSDDFFMQRGVYVYEAQKIGDAHEFNQKRAFHAVSQGMSPVLIDNTNTQMWEMKAYAMMAIDFGYIIEILEPDTWWAFNDKELAKRNAHNVPKAKIKDMLDRYEKNVSAQKLLSAYNLVYKFQKPPQFRRVPPLTYSANQNGYNLPPPTKSKSTPALHRQPSADSNSTEEGIDLMDFTYEITNNNNQSFTPNWERNPVDDILMSVETNVANLLQPNRNLFDENAWGIDKNAIQSWGVVTPLFGVNTPIISTTNEKTTKVDTNDGCTTMEVADFAVLHGNITALQSPVLRARNRDINTGTPIRSPGVPKKIMVDKSSLTEEIDDKDDDSQIRELCDLFPKIPAPYLREIYERCCKHFDWTVDVLLDDKGENAVEDIAERDVVVPPQNGNSGTSSDDNEDEEMRNVVRKFKGKHISEDSRKLQRCLQQKFDISKEHYSEHVLKVKHSKFGSNEAPQPSSSTAPDFYDSDTDSEESDPKNMVEVNLGDVFVAQLETLFGGDAFALPKGFQPVIQIPTALASQIYSLYVESICQQMDAQNDILERLEREDAEFARKLQQEEEEEIRRNAIPNLREIMDEQTARSMSVRDSEEWKSLTADNLAARLTRQKLYSIFPSVNPDTLLEILTANGNDYKRTVQDLMASVEPAKGDTARNDEPPLNQHTLEEMKEAEQFCAEDAEPEQQQPPTYYRDIANQHLSQREQLYEKARTYYQRGMREVAVFYSELAKKETRSFERANASAAVAFAEEHSKNLNCDHLDLHYLYVKEAITVLDIFIDKNINLLRSSARRFQDLFVITGRGKNSAGGRAKIKPAVKARLRQRHIGFVEYNPGLLKITVVQTSPMSNDL